MTKIKNTKHYKYILDATGFFKCMHDNHVTWLKLCIEANTNQSVLSRLQKGMNVETYTIIKLIASLENLIGHEIKDKNSLFILKNI